MAENQSPENESQDDQHEQAQDDTISEDSIRKLLFHLTEKGSLEDIQKFEGILRIASEARAARTAVSEMRVQLVRERLEAKKEELRLRFEAYKNVTVLDSGALVAFAVITHYLLGSVGQGNLIYGAYSAVLVSLCTSLAMMFVLSDVIGASGPSDPESTESRAEKHQPPLLIRMLSPAGFFIGLVLFLLFLGSHL